MAEVDIREDRSEGTGVGQLREPARAERPGQKSLTIGAVCKQLDREFPDISISKIRYLEDQKLLAPRRTQGGYRLYSPADVARLKTILRLQRDEFLPLRVIRQELAAGRAETEVARFGVGGRNLRVFRTSADREAALLEQILAPALRSRNPDRRKEAVEALENLAAIASHLKYLLLVRDLRKIAG